MEATNDSDTDLSTQLSQLFRREFKRSEGMFSSERKIMNRDYLTAYSATARGDSKKMWNILADELKKYDEHVTAAQRDDANSVLVFVRYDLLLLMSVE